jgi:hypothetical protein
MQTARWSELSPVKRPAASRRWSQYFMVRSVTAIPYRLASKTMRHLRKKAAYKLHRPWHVPACTRRREGEARHPLVEHTVDRGDLASPDMCRSLPRFEVPAITHVHRRDRLGLYSFRKGGVDGAETKADETKSLCDEDRVGHRVSKKFRSDRMLQKKGSDAQTQRGSAQSRSG